MAKNLIKTSKFLLKAREITKLNQKQFGSLVGLTNGQICRAEQGNRGLSGEAVLDIIALIKKTNPADLEKLI